MGEVITLPVIRIERHAPSLKSTTDALLSPRQRADGWRGQRKRRRMGHPAMRKAMNALYADAGSIECWVRWLSEVANKGDDVRALGAMMDPYLDWAVFDTPQEVDEFQKWICAMLAEYKKRFPPPKPRRVK